MKSLDPSKIITVRPQATHDTKQQLPNFEGIWTRYIENGERPLETLVQEAAQMAQECLDKAYAA